MPALPRLIMLSVALIATTSSAAPGQIPADSVIERIIRERVEAGRSTGIVVGALDSDGTERIVSWPSSPECAWTAVVASYLASLGALR